MATYPQQHIPIAYYCREVITSVFLRFGRANVLVGPA
jgi:hypothetical protein